MKADTRPFSMIDTGYLSNPKWFRVEQYLRAASEVYPDVPLALIVIAAQQAHLQSILYCTQNFTDGVFPTVFITRTVGFGLDPRLGELITEALFHAELWHDNGDETATVHDFLEHQVSTEERKKRSESAKKAAATRWKKNNINNTDTDADADANACAADTDTDADADANACAADTDTDADADANACAADTDAYANANADRRGEEKRREYIYNPPIVPPFRGDGRQTPDDSPPPSEPSASSEPSESRQPSASEPPVPERPPTASEPDQPPKPKPKPKSGRKRQKAVSLPDGWAPNNDHYQLALRLTVNAASEADKFRDHAKATGRTLRDWDAGFRNWLRNAADYRRTPSPRPQLRAVGAADPWADTADPWAGIADPWAGIAVDG